MPPVIIAAAAAYVGAISLTAFVVITASYVVGQYQAGRARAKARDAYNASLKDRLVSTTTVDGFRSRVYGRVRNVDGILFKATRGDKSQYYTLVVALAGHECDAIETVYFNDTPLTLDSNGYVLNAPWGGTTVASGGRLFFGQGTVNLTGGNGSATMPDIPIAATVKVSIDGNLASSSYVSVSGSTVTVTGFDGYTGTATVNYQWNQTASAASSKARVRKYLGTPGQDLSTVLAPLFPGLITSGRHRFAGICCLLVDLEYDQDAFPSGVPQISAVIRGAKVTDRRTGVTAWSQNPAVIADDWARYSQGGGAQDSELVASSFIAAANACDVSHTFSSTNADGTVTSTTRPMYTCNIVCRTDANPSDTLSAIVESMAGGWAWTGGQLRVRAGAYSAPVATLTESWCGGQGDIDIIANAARNDLINVYVPTIANEAQAYVAAPVPRVAADAYISLDGGELPRDINLEGVTDADHAQHICGVLLRDQRQGLTGSIPCNLSAYPIEVFDTIALDLPRFGFSGKTVMVTGWQFSQTGGVILTWKETDASIFDPDAGFTRSDAAPNTQLANPFYVPTLSLNTPLSGTAQLLKQADGTIVSRILVSWSAVQDAGVLNGGTIEIRYGLATLPSSQWQVVTVPGTDTRVYLDGVQDGAIYVISARCRNKLVTGDWSTLLAHKVVGKTAAPTTPSGFAFADAPGGSMLTWNANTDTDYLESRLALGSTYAGATELWRGSANSFFWLQATAGTYTVWLTHRDTSGNVSTPVSLSVVVSAASASLVQIEYSVDGSTAWHTTFTTGDIYMRQRVGSTGAWQGPIRIVGQTGPTGPTGPTGSTGSPGTDATQAATVTLWQWATATPTDPSGSSTYTWSSGAHSGYTGGGGWATSIPANPGTAGIKLWQAVKTITASATTSSSTVSWASGFSVAAVSGNGNNGSAGLQSATPTVYQWASSIPAGPSGAATYTWSTASFGAAPSGWSLTPGTSPSAGFTLWAASVQVQDSAANTTTAFNWTSASITARGYAGLQGGTARYAYARIAGNPTPSTATVTTSGNSSFPGSTSWGLSASWAASDPNPSSTSTLYQTDGVYDPATGNTVWTTPYISSLKVGNLSAVAANTGSLTVDSTLTLSGSGMINQGAYTGFAWPASGTGFHLGPQGLLMGNNNTGGYVEIDSNGNYIDIGKAGGPRLLWQVSGSVGTLSLTGATLTAGLIQTSSSGTRVTINESGNNSIAFYDGASIGAYIGTGGPVTAYGFFGLASSGTKDGVYAQAYSGNGVSAYSAQSYGVNASSGGSFPAVGGSSTNGDGVYGVTNGSGHALHGKALGTGKALYAEGPAQITGAFGCNGKAPQAAVASGGTLAGVIAALVANGILSS
jgi:hypothetical protein